MHMMSALTLIRSLTTVGPATPAEAAVSRPDDLALARRCAEGEPDAWAQFVRTYQRPVYQVALGVLGSPPDAEDAAQETFVAALTAIRRYRGDATLRTWLSRIAMRIAMRHARRRQMRMMVERALLRREASPARGPEEMAADQETVTAIWEHIGTLPRGLRVPLVLREFQQFSYRDIAEVLQVPVGTVQSRLHRARALLRERLSADHRVGVV